MIILQDINKNNYIGLSYDDSYIAQTNGFIPYARDEQGVYFKKTQRLELFLKERGIQTIGNKK